MIVFETKLLSQITDNLDHKRIPLSSIMRENLNKIFPYYGAQGIIDYVDNFIFDGEFILVAEDGENLKSQKNKICNLVNGKFWVNNHAHIIRGRDGYNTQYLFYKLNTLNFQRYITGSAQPKLTKENLNNIELSIHDKNTQQKIATILSSLDTKIQLNNRINAELEAIAKTLYNYWFVQFDFPDENGKPYKSSSGAMEYNTELKREIPKGWKAAELNRIVEVSNDSINPMDASNKDFKHYSIPIFDATNSYAVEKGSTIKSNKFTVTENDVLVSKLNPWFSRVVYPLDEEDLVCSTEFVVWRSQDYKIKNFLFITAIQDPFISYCTQSATGTSNSHKRVNPTVMMKYTIAYNQKIAESYGKKVDSVLKKIITNQAENRQLAELRDWLLPMLMNGQVSVA